MRKLVFIFLLFKISASAQLNADFSASAVNGCTPFVVQFTDLSKGNPTSWFWDFGNGTTSTLQNPAATYTTNGIFNVRLIVKNSAGEDYEQKNNYITVNTSPQAGFYVVSGDSGCVALQSSFRDTSSSFNTSINSWLWDFNDGTTSTQQNPTHTFNTAGEYNVSLTVKTPQGCSSTQTRYNAIIAGNKPTVAFSASPLNGCASTYRSFKNKSSGKITETKWSFGDGGVSYDHNPLYHYLDTGKFSVKLVVSENGCKDSATQFNYISVSGPVAKFNSVLDCSDKETVSFYDHSIDVTTRLWNFGDGQTTTTKSPTHTYTNPGIYYITLSETGTTCTDTARDTVYIKTSFPKVNVSPVSSFYCKNDSIEFLVTGYDPAIAKSITWNFGDGNIKVYRGVRDTVEYAYTQNGKFAPTIYLKDIQGCTDTAQLTPSVFIKGPTAQFQSAANGCTNSPFNFTDHSTANNGVPITNWSWSFGDGSTSTAQNPPGYKYPFSLTYNVNLKVTDADKCSDSITHAVTMTNTPTVDAGNDTFACAGSSVLLNASGAATYSWKNNSDLSCTQCANPTATPSQPVTYYVTGITNGCSASDSIKIKVQTKETLTAQPDSLTICEGRSVTLNISGTDNFSWLSDNTLSSTTIENPVATPTTSTIYTAIGKDSNNCFTDTVRVNVAISPKPLINITDSIVDVIAGTNFTILAIAGSDVQSFQWSPLLGLSCYDCLQPTTTVYNSVTYVLTGINEFGCLNSDSITIIALCDDQSLFIPNTFSPNNDGMNDYFYPRSNGSLLVKSMLIFNRWGQLLFQKRNFYPNANTDGWNGKYNNVLQKPDVYIYMMELQCAGNKTFLQKGTVTLIR